MVESYAFLKAILDSVTEQMAVIDTQGAIVFVNQSWISFAKTNQCTQIQWENVNYLAVCDQAASSGDAFSTKAAKGIRKVIKAETELFYLEYTATIETQKLWFMMRVTPLTLHEKKYFVISHQNITQRKYAEETVLHLSRIDSLTKLPNRHYFNQFLKEQWKKCSRLSAPITLAIIDLDYFKCINDTYGHPQGDAYLIKIGRLLAKMVKKPSDLCARYGGEEFIIVLANTPHTTAIAMMQKLLRSIRDLAIPNPNSPIMPIMTASIGLMTHFPNRHSSQKELIQDADDLLYQAKENGRNQLVARTQMQPIKP